MVGKGENCYNLLFILCYVITLCLLGQLILLGLDSIESETIGAALDLETTLVPFSEIGGTKPSVTSTGTCTALVTTFRFGSNSASLTRRRLDPS